uniref:Protein kinase domain-containing protein n=1 Tax=Glycine max TaxID=3847 RepID=I1JY48_SOYBN
MANREENNEGHKFTVKYVGLNGMECEGKLPRRVVGVRNHCYLLKSKIGEGSFSAVWRAEQRPPTGVDVAVKQVFLSKLNPRLKACLDCEINFLSSVNHPNIIRLLHFFQDDGCVYLVLEFCAGGNLASYIQNHGRVQQQIARKFMQQLGSGLKVLHSHDIIHRDLKPEVGILYMFSGHRIEFSKLLKMESFTSLCHRFNANCLIQWHLLKTEEHCFKVINFISG